MRDLLDSYNRTPLAQLLGVVVDDLERGRARVSLALRPEFANWFGTLHGGVIMALADHAFGCAVNTLEGRYFAVQFNIYLLAPSPTEGRLLAEATVEHAGRRLSEAAVVITDERARVIARATGLVMAIESTP